ncbi:ribonuclease H-like domain-containing protein, partial [Tanacetum coccineum]
MDLQDQGAIDSGCSRHMTGNMSYLTDFEEINRGYVTFRGNLKGGKITGRDTIKTGNLDFENVYFVRELKFNLFSVLQMCDKKNSVLFNDTECIFLSPNFKLTDESHVLLKVPRKNNMYSVDLKNIIPKGGLTCFFLKATSDESKLWHRMLGHINFKTMNKLVKENLVRGKFDGKADEGFFVGYSINSKAFRVFNSRTRIVEENLHVQFSEYTPNIAGSGPNWLFDIDALTKSMNYKPVVAGNQSKLFKNISPNGDSKPSGDDEDVGREADMNNLDAFMLAPRENKNREPIRRNVIVETKQSQKLWWINMDLDYDCSDDGSEEGHTNFALVENTSLGSSSLKLRLMSSRPGVGFDSQVVDSHVFDSQENERYKTSEGYHAVPPPYIGNFMPPKYDLILADEGEYVFSGLEITGNPQLELQEKGVIDSGCSRHMTRNKSYLSDYEEIDGGFVAFGGDPKGGRIIGKGKIST